jgi:two-component system response regulator RegX3
MGTRRVLIVGAEPKRGRRLAERLRREGYACTLLPSPADDDHASHAPNGFDLVIADASSEEVDPCRLSRELRAAFDVPIMTLCNPDRDDEERIAACLEQGADECIHRPTSWRLFLAMVGARLRQNGNGAPAHPVPDKLDFGELKINLKQRTVFVRGHEVSLTPKEFDVLAELAADEGVPVRSSELLERVWGYDAQCRTRTLDVHICRLRTKLERDPANPELIVTVPRHGYKLCRPQK